MVKVAVIGAGYWGANLIRNFSSFEALGWICDKDQQKLKSYSHQYPDAELLSDYRILLEKPEVTSVVISTPAETHYLIARHSLEAGKDVFVEKPLALTTAEAEELASLADEKERILMVGHLLLYHPAILKINQMIKSGEIGRVNY
ncbi:MAG: Gfo/Idh/MocA family protein, partial [Fidelibacterota bacterium]